MSTKNPISATKRGAQPTSDWLTALEAVPLKIEETTLAETWWLWDPG